jgi:hypothetical protein
MKIRELVETIIRRQFTPMQLAIMEGGHCLAEYEGKIYY